MGYGCGDGGGVGGIVEEWLVEAVMVVVMEVVVVVMEVLVVGMWRLWW